MPVIHRVYERGGERSYCGRIHVGGFHDTKDYVRFAVTEEYGKDYARNGWTFCEDCWDPLFLLSLSAI